MYRAYKDKAKFFLVYTKEAHANQLKSLGCNQKTPSTLEERADVAKKCTEGLKLSIPVLLADMEGKVEKEYTPWPARACIVGKDGKTRFLSRASPRGIDPAQIKTALKKEVSQQ